MPLTCISGASGAGCKLRDVQPLSAEHDQRRPADPEIDAAGVDRAQIRAMLALTPEERLRRVEEFVEAALEIRELNGTGPLR
jgi:hypothetical protein